MPAGLMAAAGCGELAALAILEPREFVDGAVFLVAFGSALVVGTSLAVRRPEHPVGWLFQGLALSIGLAGVLDNAAVRGAPPLVAVLADRAFIPWLVLIALIMLLTPTGAPPARWGWVRPAVLGGGSVWGVAGVLSGRPLDAPLDGIDNPVDPGAFGGVLGIALGAAGVVTGLCVLAAAVSLIARFRSGEADERRRLWWMAVVAVPLPAVVAATYVGAYTDLLFIQDAAAAVFVALLPVGAALAITRYQLYDVDRILSRAVTYLLVSGILVITYVSAVAAAGRVMSGELPPVLATLATVSVAAPAYRAFQEAVDRRFSRRKFDAVRVVRAHLRDPSPGLAIDDVLRRALGDRDVRVAYWIGDRRRWVGEDGLAARPGPIEMRRDGRLIAAIDAPDRRLATLAATEALTELDNAGLRAAIALQLTEVRESRARLAAAQLEERRRIERNLHDGAQQRLLALALQLRAAHLNGDADRLRAAVGAGIDELQAAVADLRELANGLNPAALADGGLSAALEDLAARTPVPIEIQADDRRYPAPLEATAWFIICEAIANAVKHAGPGRITVDIGRDDATLTVKVADDGIGGADPEGRGLRGIADRAAAAGGRLSVGGGPSGGTLVAAELPCAS